ncbi:MAG TPA: Mur ligase family protein, partial [Gaiellaceae bacterium]|nr:Mur ligase family protein [Gaiellaceae bacterium]
MDNIDWLAALSPWPEEFGLGRMHTLLSDLGDPQLRYPAIHIVGTNGKTSTTLMTAALLRASGMRVGAYISPHVRGWAERIQIDGADANLDAALARVRPHAEGATQFEVLTAAALAEFAAHEVDVAVVEAGLGGRYDASNVLDARVVVLTNVSLEHTDILGETREAIAAEKLAVVVPGAHVVIGEPEWRDDARARGAAAVEIATSNVALAVAAAEAFLGRRVDPAAAQAVRVPGRLEQRGEHPLEIWDGAHNLAGIGYLLSRLPDRTYTIVCSILADKNPDAMLATLAAVGDTFVATES